MANTTLKTIVDTIADATVTQLTLTTDTGDNEIVAAQSGKKIYVIAWDWCDGSAANITFKSGSDIIAKYELAANQGALGFLRSLLYTASGEALSLQTSAIGTFKLNYTTDQRLAYALRLI